MIKLNILICDMSLIFSLPSGPLPPTAMLNFLLLAMFRKARYRLQTDDSLSCLLICFVADSAGKCLLLTGGVFI